MGPPGLIRRKAAWRGRPAGSPTLETLAVAWQKAIGRSKDAIFREMEQATLGFLWQQVRRYTGGKEQLFDDAYQAALMGLHRSAERFDIKRGCKFLTYAAWWIRSDILKMLQHDPFVIHVPVQKIKDHRPSLYYLDKVPFDGLNNPPSESELIVEPTTIDDLDRKQRMERVLDVLETMDPRVQQVIAGRLDGKSLEEIGTELERNIRSKTTGALSRERVRQLEQMFIEKLKKLEPR